MTNTDMRTWVHGADSGQRPGARVAPAGGSVAALLATLLLCAGSVALAADDSPRHFEINAMPLANALMAFGGQSGLTVVAPTTLTAGKTAPAVHGELTASDALSQLLKGSGLTFVRAANGTIAIQKSGTAGTTATSAREPAATEAASKDQDGLSEVIVTAQKRSENLLQVPAPVTAVQAADLARQGAVRLADYSATVPGLNLISTQPGQTAIILRGITTGLGFATAATTSTYIDDSPFGTTTANALGSVTTVDLDPATLQRVEVLRGPQGTLYGASSMGGLIKYVTVPPSLTHYSGHIDLDGSSVDGGGQGWGVRGMWTGPLIADKLGVTLSAYDRHDPGYIDNVQRNIRNVNASRVSGGRLAVLWQPTDKLTVQLSAMLQANTTSGASTVDVDANLTPIYGKYKQLRYVDEQWDLHSALYSLRANYDFGWAALTSISSYQRQSGNTGIDFTNRFGPLLSSIINVPNLGVTDHVTLADHKITQELRLSSPDSNRLEWLGGFYFTHEKSVQPEDMTGFTLPNVQPVPGLDHLFVDPNNDSYKEYAVYGDLTYHFTPKFKVLAGVRFTHDSEDNFTPFSGLFNGPPAVAIASTSSNSTTYLFSPSYNFNDQHMAYIRVASGFRPGGPTGLTTTSVYAGAPSTYGPDTLTSYELGYKASFPQQRMTLDLSAFDVEWSKMQVLSEIGGFIITGNGSDARSNGFEAAWTWKPLAGLSLAANAAYTHAYLTTDAPGIGGRKGDELPDVPKFSANVSADYDFPISSVLNGSVGASFSYTGERTAEFVAGLPANMSRTVMPEYHLLDLRAGVDYRNLSVRAYLKNATNEYGIIHVTSEVIDGFSPPLAAAVIQPRTFGLSISYRY
ncbi:MAG: TonB-dependent receptor [Proteobacteria bacterium]|nr:TonB-dependent receptor [Pseudomonadota bacterium]